MSLFFTSVVVTKRTSSLTAKQLIAGDFAHMGTGQEAFGPEKPLEVISLPTSPA